MVDDSTGVTSVRIYQDFLTSPPAEDILLTDTISVFVRAFGNIGAPRFGPLVLRSRASGCFWWDACLLKTLPSGAFRPGF